jgi:hypothetical protein
VSIEPDQAEQTDRTGEPPEEPEFLVFVDPEWVPSEDEPDPSAERIVGAWVLETDGSMGRFTANPEYEPLTPSSPTDPVDGLLRRVASGESDGDGVLPVMDGTALSMALAEDGSALVVLAPDDVPSVAVTSAPFHRQAVPADAWREVTLAELAAALPDSGVDVLVNPGAATSIRVLASAVRDAVGAKADGAEGSSAEDTPEP